MKRLINQEILGMARVGYSGNYEVYVNTNDGGKIPHFHYRDKNDWNKFHTCIRIDAPVYFHHDGKEDVLNSSQRKQLQQFMNSKISIKRYQNLVKNNWELVCFLWDMNNSDVLIQEDIDQPDYTQLPDA